MTQAIQVIRVLLLLLGLLACVQPAVAVESVTYLHNDAAGSPVAATDAAGNVIWREGYRAYGERTRNETAARSNRQFFHGKAFDADSGLSYFGARYYDPVVGRFMAIDPAGFDESNLHSVNRYAYGNNNPYRYVDPNGKVALPIVIAVGLWLGAEVFGPNPVGPAHAPDAINPTSFPDGSAALKSSGLALGVIGSIERQGAKVGSEVASKGAARSVDELSQAAAAADRGGLTAAGRALQKHGGREGSAFPAAKGNPLSVNQQGQHAVDDILTSPGSATVTRNHARFGQVTEVRAPDGRGVRYGADGKFIGFLEPNK